MTVGRLHVLTDTRDGRDALSVVAAALSAGAQVVQVRAKGGAVLLVSEDLDELLELSDRIAVMSDGRIVFETTAANADRLRNTPHGLANALRGLGTGAMEPLWERLGELTMPVTLVAGERDEKFRAIAEQMAARLPNAQHVTIPDTGHAPQLEDPEGVARAIAYQSGSPSSSASA